MNIISQSIDIALRLLPSAKSQRSSRNKFFHFAFGYDKNKLVGIGQNNPEKINAKALKLARKFNIEAYQEFPYLHAETDLISKLWGRHYIDNSLKVVILRLNKRGELRNSCPCEKCAKIMTALNINDIYWSTEDGFTE
jgi:deoxycytidylate deaminase